MTKTRLIEIFNNEGYTVLDVFSASNGERGYIGHLHKGMCVYHYFIDNDMCIMQTLSTVCLHEPIYYNICENNLSYSTLNDVNY